MQQQTLFNLAGDGRPTVRPKREAAPTIEPARGKTATSNAAADAVRPHANRLRTRVYEFIEARDGATDEEICRELGLLSDTARARRCELRDAGFLVDSGERRPTSRGRPAVVWTVTSKTFPRKPNGANDDAD